MTTAPTELVAPRQQDATLTAALVAVAVLGAGIALDAAARVDAPITSDVGFVAVLQGDFWLGLLLLNLVTGVLLWRRPSHVGLMSLMFLLMIAVLYGVPAAATGTPRTEVAWRHLGIAGELGASGRIDPGIDAYFNWPGFFAGLASFTELTGLRPETVALMAPVVNAILWTAGVALIAWALASDLRHLWVTVWIFLLANWIDQDYLSPQAFTFFLYLVVVALLLTALGATPRDSLRRHVADGGVRAGIAGWWRHRTPLEADPRRRVAAVWVVVLLSVVIIASHQLTPVMLAAALGILTVTGRCWAPRLLPLVGVLVVLWMVTAAATYLSGHPVLFVRGIEHSTQAAVVERVAGSPGHLQVLTIRSLLTGSVLLLALAGAFRMYRRGSRDLRPVLLMGFPFLLVPLQSYGGEMLLRATLFALPFAAFLAAGAFVPGPRATVVRRTALVVVLAILLTPLLVTARYGNAAYDTFTHAEVEGSRAMYRLAPEGAILLAGANPTPWRYQDYAAFRHRTLTAVCPEPIEPRSCYRVVRELAAEHEGGAVLMLSRANAESMRIQGDLSERDFRGLVRLVEQRGEARLVYRNEDVSLYRFPRTEA